MTRYSNRRDFLRGAGLLPLEARLLARIPSITPALRAVVKARSERYDRFTKIAARKVESGQWKVSMLQSKWVANITRMYQRNHWRVQGKYLWGTKQPKMKKGSPNPYAMYRAYENVVPDKGYRSPWEVRQLRSGKGKLAKGLIFIQRKEREGKVSSSLLRGWIANKKQAIEQARPSRRPQLRLELRRLEAML